MKRSCPAADGAQKAMKMTYHSLTACVLASGTACEDARLPTVRQAGARSGGLFTSETLMATSRHKKEMKMSRPRVG
jgi:hypothetical protein